MITGTPSIFAIESGITQAYQRLSFFAFGFFVIHVGGRRYGVHKPDATFLSCSLQEVEDRIASRGSHFTTFADMDAGEIADAFLSAVYAEKQEESYFDLLLSEFVDSLYSKQIIWAPDGDAAFDDGSYVLQFDVQDYVRLIAFNRGRNSLYDPATLRDVLLPADDFYCILQHWRDSFRSEWMSLEKT